VGTRQGADGEETEKGVGKKQPAQDADDVGAKRQKSAESAESAEKPKEDDK
jgi:hypothetical protein